MSSIMDSVRSIIVSARTKKDSTGPSSGRRGLFGTVTPRYDAAGNLIAWQVRYPDPKRPGKKVQRQFKPDMEHEAHQWLEGERHLVELDRKNIQEWVHPSERRRRKRASLISFEDYVIRWAEEYRLPNGERIAGGMRRNLYLDIAHFMPGFKGKLLTVRHSVNRGYSDRGSTRIARTKTDSSRRTVPIPDELGRVGEKVAIKHYQRIVAQHRNQIVNQLAEDFIKAAVVYEEHK